MNSNESNSGTHSEVSPSLSRDHLVDAFKVLEILFENKALILLTTLFFTSIGTIYSYSATQWWSAKFYFSPANTIETYEYSKHLQQFQFLFDRRYSSNLVYNDLLEKGFSPVESSGSTKLFQALQSPEHILNEFKKQFNDNKNKSKFFASSTSLNIENPLTLNEWLDRTYTTAEATTQAHNAEDAKIYLDHYLDFVSVEVKSQFFETVKILISLKNDQLEQELSLYETLARTSRDQEFIQKINSPIEELKYKIQFIKSHPINEKTNFYPFNLENEIYHLKKMDAPNRKVLTLLSFMIGITLGVLISLGKYTLFLHYNNKSHT